MRKLIVAGLLLALITLIFVGCGSSTSEYKITERAKARDEAQGYYMTQLGIPAGGESPYQKWLLKQFAPTYATYQAQRALSPKGNDLWGDYLRNTGIMGAREQAPGLFRQALALPLQKQRVFQEKMGSYLFDGKMGSLLVDFMRAVLGQTYGPRFGESAVKRMPLLELEFKGAPGYTERSFLDFLRQKYNLAPLDK